MSELSESMYKWVNSLVLATAIVEVRTVRDWADRAAALEQRLDDAGKRPMQPIKRSYIPKQD